jgi:DNA-binding response OmpR family regulator
MSATILVVDDDVQLTYVMDVVLREEGFTPLVANTAEEGLRLAGAEEPDLALLDVMVPHIGGWELCRQIREWSNMPIIFLTALDETHNVVRGLELGADDYLTKPFVREELLARIRAQLRRVRRMPSTAQRLSFGDGMLVVDLASRQVFVSGDEVELTPREFDLLAALARNAGRVLATAELAVQAWGEAYRDAGDNVKPYIHYLRKKLESDASNPRWIHTARGVGYRFVDDR